MRTLDRQRLDNCPLCGAVCFRTMACPICGPWWREFDLPCPGGRFEPPAVWFPRLAMLCGLKGESFTLLDIGGGGGRVGDTTWPGIGVNFHAVLDIFPPAGNVSNFTTGDGCDAAKIYGEKSFDIVQACEVLEHLEKARGPSLLAAALAVAKQLVLLTTPNGFQAQDPAHAEGEPWANNPYQKHLSGWVAEELLELGWNVYANGISEQGTYTGAQLIGWQVL